MSTPTKMVTDHAGRPIPALTPGDSQRVAVGGTSAQSTALSSETIIVRVQSDVACYLAFGDNPTATNTDLVLPANTVEYFGVAPGSKVAVLQVGGAGFLNIVEMR